MSHTEVQELRRSSSKAEIELEEDPEKQRDPRYLRGCATFDEGAASKTRIQRLTARLARWGVETNGYVALCRMCCVTEGFQDHACTNRAENRWPTISVVLDVVLCELEYPNVRLLLPL